MADAHDMIEAHLQWMRSGYADTTVKNAGKFLHRLHRVLPEGLHGAIEEELAAFLGSNPKWSKQTKSTYYKHIVRFYRWATRPGDPWLSFDPSAGLPQVVARRGLPRPASESDAERCINRLPMPWRLVCRLTALASLRPAEVATITRDDVTQAVITIKGKGDKTRSIPTHPLIWDIVQTMGPGPLITRKGQPVTPDWVSHSGAYTLRKFGMNITLYRLRHYFGTEIQARFKDLRVTQELMGHASPITTAVYTQVTSERMREAVAMLPFSSERSGAEVADAAGTAATPTGSAAAVPPQPPRSSAAGQLAGGRAARRRSLRRVRP